MERRNLLIATTAILAAGVTGVISRSAFTGAKSKSTSPIPLKQDYLATISQISELIIPATDTPGAIEAGVPAFIVYIYSEWYRPNERQQFLDGLDALQALAIKEQNKAFSKCSDSAQQALLMRAEASEANTALGMFFSSMKQLTVRGYYTSKIGAQQELIYNPVPLQYKGDYLFNQVGRQWAY